MLRISWVAAQVTASQEGLSSMSEWVSEYMVRQIVMIQNQFDQQSIWSLLTYEYILPLTLKTWMLNPWLTLLEELFVMDNFYDIIKVDMQGKDLWLWHFPILYSWKIPITAEFWQFGALSHTVLGAVFQLLQYKQANMEFKYQRNIFLVYQELKKS
jgi:hypothetical protein